MSRRIAIRIALAVVLFIVGLFVLIRSCLSKFDERAAIGGGSGSQSASQFLVFEKDGSGVIFSLVKFDKTTSYSQKGGITQRSVNTTYYAQTNDLATAAKTATKKIKTHSQIKAYPVEIIGAANGKAWLFAGELMAYDPFTLTKLADASILEEKNPLLKGKLINERRYYVFDTDTKQITITTADGAVYSLNTATLIATAADEEDKGSNEISTSIKQFDKQTKELREQRSSIYNRLREYNRLYREKQVSAKQYKDSAAFLENEANRLGKLADSIERLVREARDIQRETDDIKRQKENTRHTGSGFTGMKTNCDTINGRWYGLFTNEELKNINDHFDYRAIYDDAARNKLFTAALTAKERDWIIGEERNKAGDGVYLQGGFLFNKETGIPVHLPDGFLVVYKDRIGRDGLVQLARINTSGKIVWTINTGLKEFYDWQLRGNRLVVTGTDNQKLSSGEVNVLQVINLQNGTMAAYDFFTDKHR